jgi:CRP/FNR family nitrogen fixation transcriptional regulator
MQTVLSTESGALSPPARLLCKGASSRSVRPLGVTRRLDRDEQLFATGDLAAYFYRVVSGGFRTYKLLDDGRRQIDAFHLPGDIIGFEREDEHRFTAESLGPSTVIAYRRRSIEATVSEDGTFSMEIVASIMRALERAQDHMLLLGRKSALEKIATFLLDMRKRSAAEDAVDLPMSRSDIADHLGLTIETVSRCLTELERRGVIELHGQRRLIRLRDERALRRLDA